jgi:hypothetical protein
MRQVNNVINQNNIFRRQGNTNASVRPQNTTLNTRLLQSLLPYQRSALQRVRDVIRHYTTNAGNTYINGDRSTTNSTPVHAHPRGQLFWLPTGAGKTTIAAGIVLSHMLSPGPIRTHVYVVSSQRNMKINSQKVYQNELRKHYRPWSRESGLKKKMFMSYKMAHNAFFQDGVATHDGFREALDRGDRFVFVIDEIHDLASSTDADEKQLAIHFQGELRGRMAADGKPQIIVYGLTATPGDTMNGFAKVLTIVGPTGVSLSQQQLMDRVVFRRNKSRLLHYPQGSSNGMSVFPKEEIVTHPTTYDTRLYLVSMAALGRAALQVNNYTRGSYVHKMEPNKRVIPREPGQRILQTITKAKTNRNVFYNGTGTSRMSPSSTNWLNDFTRFNLYVSVDDVRKMYPKFPKFPSAQFNNGQISSYRAKVESIFPESQYNVYILRKTKTNVTNQTYIDESVYFVPKNGVLETLKAKVYKYTKGRKLVFFRDPTAARLFGRMLEKVKASTGNFKEFNNMTPRFEIPKGAKTPEIQTSMDLLFHASNARLKNAMNRNNAKDIVNALYDVYRSANHRANQKKVRNFVVATPMNGSEKMVSLVSKVMNGDIKTRSLIGTYIDDVIRARQSANVVDKAMELRKKIDNFNLHGDRLELLIIGGGGMYQGLNINALRHVYIPDESHIPKQIEQVLGRASRGFGHMKLPEASRRVCIHMFDQQPPSILRTPGNQPLINTRGNVKGTTHARMKMVLGRLFTIGHTNASLEGITESVVAGLLFLWHHQHTLNSTGTRANTLTINTTLKTHRERHPPYALAANQLKQLKNIANTQRNNR